MKTKIAMLAAVPVIITLIMLNITGARTQADQPPDEKPLPSMAMEDVPRISRQEAARYMLDLVNEARRKNGLQPVQLGQNPAAQMHAEASMKNCSASHWDQWGLKPNQRYTLMGGTGTGNENALGRSYCPGPGEGIGPYQGITRGDIFDTMVMWLESPGHRQNILHSRHTTMNAGIAWDDYNISVIQQFSSDYVEYRERPSISPQGVLTMSGAVKNAALDTGQQIVVQIGYDPPPHPLTRGQLSRTYALCKPRTVGTIRAEPNGETAVSSTTQAQTCRDPYENSPMAKAPGNMEESERHWKEAKGSSSLRRDTNIRVRRITPRKIQVTPDGFDITADLRPITEVFGSGIYSVTIWGTPGNSPESTILSEQSVFWNTHPPDGNPYTTLGRE